MVLKENVSERKDTRKETSKISRKMNRLKVNSGKLAFQHLCFIYMIFEQSGFLCLQSVSQDGLLEAVIKNTQSN